MPWSGWGLVSQDRLDVADNALFRQLLMDNALVSDDALGRYLASIEGENLTLDASIAALFAKLGERSYAGTLIVPDAARLLVPSPIDPRGTRPIVLRGYMPVSAPPIPPTEETRTTLAPKHVASPTVTTGEGTETDLSSALAACVMEDRSKVLAPTRRRRFFVKKAIWAAAAALAAVAIVPSVSMRPGLSTAPTTVAASTPATTKPSTPTPSKLAAAAIPRIERDLPTSNTHVEVKAAPPEPAPVRMQPVKMAIAKPVLVAETDKQEKSDTAAAPVHNITPQAASVTFPIAATPSPGALRADTRPGPFVARVAKRKFRKSTAGKATIVASALSLPDVLKPQ